MSIVQSKGATVHLADGAVQNLEPILDLRGSRRVFFVVDENAYRASGAADVLEAALERREVARFGGFEINPKMNDVLRGVERFREFRPDAVVAFGGGTAIDLAKLISLMANQKGSLREMVTGGSPIRRPGGPVIAIPTTAGTGSEATHFAVVYVDGEKYSVAHPSMLPVCAIVDPELTYSLPPRVTASTGLDALCQAIESIWAVGSTEQSMADAMRGAKLAWENLLPAVNDPTPQSRRGMCQASHYAGRAINISKTTAPHALSYRITSHHGIPHGFAVAMNLSMLLAFNAEVTDADCRDPRGADEVRRRIATIVELLGASDVAGACRRIEGIITSVGGAPSLSAAGITSDDDVSEIVRGVNSQRMANNPRRLDPDVLSSLLKRADVSVG